MGGQDGGEGPRNVASAPCWCSLGACSACLQAAPGCCSVLAALPGTCRLSRLQVRGGVLCLMLSCLHFFPGCPCASALEPVRLPVCPLLLEQVTQPMDLGTLLFRVDSRVYLTPQQFLADVALIPQASVLRPAVLGCAAAALSSGRRRRSSSSSSYTNRGVVHAGHPCEGQQPCWHHRARGWSA